MSTITVEMPRLAETVDEVTVLQWSVAEGDVVNEGDVLMEVETDKAIAQVPSPVTGRLVQLIVNAQDDVKTGQAIAVLQTD